MEAIIILVIIGVIGYFIYQSLPNTKYEKAKNFYNAKNYTQAVSILSEIFEKHPDAPSKLAECKFHLGNLANGNNDKLKYFNEVIGIGKRIKNQTSVANFQSVEARALLEIAKIHYEDAKDNAEKLKQNIRFIDTANKKGSESNFSSLKTKHFRELADINFKIACDKEKTGRDLEVIDAIQYYKKARNFAEKSDSNLVLNNSASRILICQLKLNQSVNLDNVSEINKSDKSFQKELYYRYTIQLLMNKKFAEADIVITQYLNCPSSDIDKLKDILKAEKINNAVRKVAEINATIDKLYNKSLTTKELYLFYDSLDEASDELNDFDIELSKRITSIKPTLFNRLLTQYIEAEQYENVITIIQNYPRFWESPEILKNLGICCYGFASKGLLTERNYQSIISGWLTAVFSDKVILKSLDETTWDDNYTFSLVDAIGSNFLQHEEIPDNVNYDEVSESNISIGSTQKELLQQFETIIHKEIHDVSLSKLVNDFYDAEKEAIENIIAQIENDIFFATPYFAISNGLNNRIIEELDNNYQTYNNEDALEAGVPYIKDSRSTVVYQYYFANSLINRAISAVESENSVVIKKLNTKDNKKWLTKFENIKNSVEVKLYNSVSDKVSEDDENEKLISIMEECISFSNQNEKLKYQFSNYVANYCISKVNNEEIDNFKALSLMKGAYLRSPNNPKIVKNFITLIRFNLMDMLNDQTRKTTEIYSILDWVKNNMSQTYKQFSHELSKARREILQQLKAAGNDISLFDDDYPLSSLNLNFGQSLNAQGLKLKKVLTYLKELGNEQTSKNPMDAFRLRQQLNLDDDDLPF